MLIQTTPALPNLILIGAMKCSTTSLHDYLNLHPEIFISAVKEIDFFSSNNAEQSLEWYTAQFNGAFKVRGESPQSYSKAHDPYHQGAPEAISRLVPDAQLIYILRDPIARYRSHIVENYLTEAPEIITHNREIGTYIKTGLYYEQISVFLEHFPLEQICFVDLDELQSDRLAVINKLFDFLKVASNYNPKMFNFQRNVNGENVLPRRIAGRKVARLIDKAAPGLLGRAASQPWVRKRFFPDSLKIALSEAELTQLRTIFAEVVARLRELTGQSFKGWSI